MLPLIGGVGAAVGFFAGYNYNTSDSSCANEETGLTRDKSFYMVSELKELKNSSPHKELAEEIIKFNTSELKKVRPQKKQLTAEQKIFAQLHNKIKNRRSVIDSD